MTKSTEQHKIEGTFRGHRHKDRLENVVPHAVPVKPQGLGTFGEHVWNIVVDTMPPGVLSPLDEPMLMMLCAQADKWYTTERLLCDSPTDRTLQRINTGYMESFIGIAKRFGLSPWDRQKVKMPKGDDAATQALKKLLESRN